VSEETVSKPANTYFYHCNCGSCGKRSAMKLISEIPYTDEIFYDEIEAYGWDSIDLIFRLVECLSCNRFNFTMEQVDGGDISVLWPSPQKQIVGLPDNINKAYKAALKVRKIDSNAFGVLLRRVLELICIDKGATGNNLHQKLQNLAVQNVIPGRLSDMALKLKDLGNIGAHAELGDLTLFEVPILESLCVAVLEYVYYAPMLISEVEARIDKLKNKSKAAKKPPNP